MMRYNLHLSTMILAMCLLVWASAAMPAVAAPDVWPGVEVLVHEQPGLLAGKHVGILTNPTGVDRHLLSTIDLIRALPGVTVVRLFAPEHGLRGGVPAGEHIGDSKDAISGLPIVTLYGATRRPTPAMLEGLDTVVYDIQDVGHRTYTFVSSLTNLMEACEAAGVEVMVLDRPDPMGGEAVGGPPLADDLHSFIGIHNVPQVYGLTPGEWARLIQCERTPKLRLTVVPMKGWRRGMTYGDLGWPWVPPSPHIPHWESSYFYAMTGTLGELQAVSEGVGTPSPFELVGAPWIDSVKLAEVLNTQGLTGVLFRPTVFTPRYGPFEGKECLGVQIHLVDPHHCDPARVCRAILETLARQYPGRALFKPSDSERYRMFLKALGDHPLAEALATGDFAGVDAYLDAAQAAYRARRAAVLIYPDETPAGQGE